MYLVWLVSIGFLLAGISRFVFPDEMAEERMRIYPELPEWTMNLIPIFEILAAGLVWTKYRNPVLIIWVTGVILFMLSVMLRRRERQSVLESYKDSFTIESTTGSLAFHVLWIAIIVYVLFQKR
jgi:hypothetical protein